MSDEPENLLRMTVLDDGEADYLLEVVTLLAGGEPLSKREQLILLMGVRWMERRDFWIDKAVNEAVAEAVVEALADVLRGET